eukprot:XP_001703100.1 predicted protein [Chlamydomonas reinhardtii]
MALVACCTRTACIAPRSLAAYHRRTFTLILAGTTSHLLVEALRSTASWQRYRKACVTTN